MTPEEKRDRHNASQRAWYERKKLDPNYDFNANYEKHKDDPEFKAKRCANTRRWQRENREYWNAYQSEYKKARYKPKKEPKKKTEKRCDLCDHCEYVGKGGYMCAVTHDIVMEDWQPTDKFNSCKGKDFKKI